MTQDAPFMIFGLPRSRTAWLSHYLAYGGARVGHDIAADCNSIDEFLRAFGTLRGSVETAGMLGWKLVRRAYPRAQLMVVRREPKQVLASLATFGICNVEAEIYMRDALLGAIAAAGAPSFRFEELSDPAVGKAIFETCLGLPFDLDWFESRCALNVQVDMVQQIAKLARRATELQAFRSEVLLANSQLVGGSAWAGLQ